RRRLCAAGRRGRRPHTLIPSSAPALLLLRSRCVTVQEQPEGLPGKRVADIDANPEDALLEVKNLQTTFFTHDGAVRAVDNVSFNVRRGEALALVGGSGCGKSVTAMSIMRLVAPPGKITGGEIRFKGRNLADISERDMRHVRG